MIIQLERAPKRQKLGGELEGKVARLLITLTVDSESSGLSMLWEQTWNRKAEAVPWFSLADVPEYCWVFSPPNDIASVINLNPPTVLFRDDYLRALSELFASSGLGNFTSIVILGLRFLFFLLEFDSLLLGPKGL